MVPLARTRPSSKPAKRRKNSPTSRAAREERALQSLANKRQAFVPLLRQVVDAVLHAHAPVTVRDSAALSSSAHQPRWVEVGSGLGQLRALLPAHVVDWVTHTELSAALSRGFAQRHPDAQVLAADVTQLPFADASVDVVLGLCAFDSFPAPERASREIARVLRPGGRFIHFLDAATNVEPVLTKLVNARRLPLPNFLADAALLEPALFDRHNLGQFLGPYHDLLSVPLSQFDVVTHMLSQAEHPMAEMLTRYASPFLEQPFDSLAAAKAFVALTSDIRNSRPMNQALTSLMSTLKQPQYAQRVPFELKAHSSLAHFESQLVRCFGEEYGFSPRLSTVVYARSFEEDRQASLRALVRRVGIIQNSEDWPAPVGVPVHELKPDLAPSGPGNATLQSHVLREAGVYCFVSERSAA